MLPFMKSDIGTVRQRIRKPAITAGLFLGVLLLDVIFRQHRLGYFLTKRDKLHDRRPLVWEKGHGRGRESAHR